MNFPGADVGPFSIDDEDHAMDAISRTDPVLIHRAAERLHRFDIGAAAGRLHLDPASGERHCYDLVNATTRRRLVRALEIARAETE